ncbi:hypothetical protein [Micromonospora sp. 15K316]|uniref:hypothetical protein n=1 Tax=Micromonospora sp. 15K316 TaxID=2530376 RepID=UPI0014047419|nr:hypothetical protein [Micromonospora sp. 15K316]
MRRRRSNVVLGCLCAALAASILAVHVPYYAIFASAALVIVLAGWFAVLVKAARGN